MQRVLFDEYLLNQTKAYLKEVECMGTLYNGASNKALDEWKKNLPPIIDVDYTIVEDAKQETKALEDKSNNDKA